ncbi:aspartyl-phosphate phosphatase Spo0E family protein [Paenibacillus flagellatus]|uniref:Aspartyl-phosphate phosphatase Spo0E family protein n=1 Tax=Paenibacillus flagellatus TaxID=2211139 RepID=A0A2V5K6M6_9BACL|nr:aspartyl-phosphate phosphatase Spo0E family protein [Paenibacillus flagellatus]PYI54472.1 hypothetical protein DLM86_13470 [Paenibacillus flagellatus]
MSHHIGLNREINQLKQLLVRTAKEHKYNFGHPHVLEISQQLDRLIVKVMRYTR